jgi:hypothetical protein
VNNRRQPAVKLSNGNIMRKRTLLALAIFALVLPAARQAEAGVDVSVDFFYNNLGDDGSWVDVGDYGYCWQPRVAVSNSSWRPYSDGYWAYTDVGWTWVSNEDFGWATYHYGRWARLRDRGWVWVPGREWGPAWVSWRTGGDYVGWAPLPPRRGYSGGEVVYEGRAINGQVDIEFDIGPAYYNFVDVRYIGGSRLRERILPPAQNVTYITKTVNVTNITYDNSIVRNYGPDYNRLSAYSTSPIQRLTLQRETNVDLNTAARSRELMKVQGNTLMVAAPQQLQAAPKTAAPKAVKAKVEKPDLETGWGNVSDAKEKAQLQQKMKSEDAKSIPPPNIKPQHPEALKEALSAAGKSAPPATAASPAATATGPAPGATPEAGKKNDQGKKGGQRKPTPAASVAPASEATPASDAVGKKIDKKGKQNQPTPQASRGASAAPGKGSSTVPSDNGKGKKDRNVNPAKTAPTPAGESKARENGSARKNEKAASAPAAQNTQKAPAQRKKADRSAPASPFQATGNRKSERANNAPAPATKPQGNAKSQRANNAPPKPAANTPPARQKQAAGKNKQPAPAPAARQVQPLGNRTASPAAKGGKAKPPKGAKKDEEKKPTP